MKRLEAARIGFIGSGRIAESIARHMLKRVDPSTKFCYKTQRVLPTVMASDPSDERRQLFDSMGINTTKDNAKVIENSDMIILAVNPQDVDEAISQIDVDLARGKVFVNVVENECKAKQISEKVKQNMGKFLQVLPNSLLLDDDQSRLYEMVRHMECVLNEIDPSSCCSSSSSSSRDAAVEAIDTTTTTAQLFFQQRYAVSFESHELAGAGKYGQVYSGLDARTRERVAIKRSRKMPDGSSDMSVEIRALNRIDHPNVVQARAFYADEEFYYLVMDFAAGSTLQDRLVLDHHLSVSEVRTIARQLVSALHAIHSEHGIIHRDIKAENIVYDASTQSIKLIDFGLCTCTLDHEDRLTLSGTIGYVSPEMASGRLYDTKTDIWSAGVLLYMLLSGKAPFYHENEQMLLKFIQSGAVSLRSRFWLHTPHDCKDFLLQMLESDPAKRSSAAQLCQHPWIQS